MISFGTRQQVFKINPQILFKTIENTHRAPVVAVLYNRIFGNVVTIAEDSECSIWRPANGEQIFSFFDTERNDETHITCANFDDAGRRLMTGDHHGVVRVCNAVLSVSSNKLPVQEKCRAPSGQVQTRGQKNWGVNTEGLSKSGMTLPIPPPPLFGPTLMAQRQRGAASLMRA